MKRVMMTLVLASMVAGCGYSEAKEAVKSKLRDPSSAEFKAVGGSGDVACGYVNAKNAFGGYTGFKKFAYNHKTKAIYLDTGTGVAPNHDIVLACNNMSDEYLKGTTDDLQSATENLQRLQQK